MSWRISILDKSPVAENETAADALARTLALAQQAENLGYHRFWIAEHHNTPQLASPPPELVIAWIILFFLRGYYMDFIEALFPDIEEGTMLPAIALGFALFLVVSVLNIVAIRRKVMSIWQRKE